MMMIEKICCRKAFDEKIAAGDLPITLENPGWGSPKMKIQAALAHNDEALFVAMRCYEAEPRATVTKHEGEVHLDSCLEFFFSPTPEVNLDYFNMEANPNGAMKFNFGAERHGRVLTYKLPDCADMKATIADGYWQLTYTIPYSLIREFAPAFEGKSGDVMRGNMYRCGELAKETSFMMLFNVPTAEPDYHRPEHFGEMVFA